MSRIGNNGGMVDVIVVVGGGSDRSVVSFNLVVQL